MKDERAEVFRDRILNGPIVKTLLWLAYPIILANLVNLSYNLVDAFWLGKLGKAAFGAPTVCWPLIMLFYSVGMGYARAGIALISQYYGAGDKRLTEKSAGNLFSSIAIVALLLSLLGYTLAPEALKLMSVPSDIYPLAVSYIRVIFLGIPLSFLGFAFNTIASALGDTKTPSRLNIISVLFNIVLDPILIFGLFGFSKMGVIGAALATVVSRSLVSFVGGYLLFKGFRGIKIGLKDLKIEGWWLKKVISIGTPLTIQQSSNSLGFTIMMSLVSRYGTTIVAAYGVVIRLINILEAFTWGINRATSIMVGQNIGAERYDRARAIANMSNILIAGSLTLGSIFIYGFREQLIAVFINKPDVIVEGSKLIQILAISIPFFGLFFTTGAIASGSGHTKIFALLSIIRLWVLRIGLSIILSFILGLGPEGLWIAMSISNICIGIASFLWLKRGTWLKRVIELHSPMGG